MKHLMGSFIHVLEGHHEDEWVTEDYAKAKGLYQSQIDKYLTEQETYKDENGIRYFWRSTIDTLFEMDFIQDEIETSGVYEFKINKKLNWDIGVISLGA